MMVTLVVAAIAVTVAGMAIWLWTSASTPGTPCDNGPGNEQAAGPAATTTGEDYWTDERMSNARGVTPRPTGC
jgi:hypothetical protein